MNKSDLAKKLFDDGKTPSLDDSEKSINLIISFISESLSKGNRIELRNFGTFSIRSRDQRVSRNPKTGTSVLVEKKHHPYFRASKHLKESLNK